MIWLREFLVSEEIMIALLSAAVLKIQHHCLPGGAYVFQGAFLQLLVQDHMVLTISNQVDFLI